MSYDIISSGQSYNDVYSEGNYYNQIYKGNELVWEKEGDSETDEIVSANVMLLINESASSNPQLFITDRGFKYMRAFYIKENHVRENPSLLSYNDFYTRVQSICDKYTIPCTWKIYDSKGNETSSISKEVSLKVNETNLKDCYSVIYSYIIDSYLFLNDTINKTSLRTNWMVHIFGDLETDIRDFCRNQINKIVYINKDGTLKTIPSSITGAYALLNFSTDYFKKNGKWAWYRTHMSDVTSVLQYTKESSAGITSGTLYYKYILSDGSVPDWETGGMGLFSGTTIPRRYYYILISDTEKTQERSTSGIGSSVQIPSIITAGKSLKHSARMYFKQIDDDVYMSFDMGSEASPSGLYSLKQYFNKYYSAMHKPLVTSISTNKNMTDKISPTAMMDTLKAIYELRNYFTLTFEDGTKSTFWGFLVFQYDSWGGTGKIIHLVSTTYRYYAGPYWTCFLHQYFTKQEEGPGPFFDLWTTIGYNGTDGQPDCVIILNEQFYEVNNFTKNGHVLQLNHDGKFYIGEDKDFSSSNINIDFGYGSNFLVPFTETYKGFRCGHDTFTIMPHHYLSYESSGLKLKDLFSKSKEVIYLTHPLGSLSLKRYKDSSNTGLEYPDEDWYYPTGLNHAVLIVQEITGNSYAELIHINWYVVTVEVRTKS